MDLETIGMSALWAMLFAYLIFGSIDYGAGFLSALALGRSQGEQVMRLVSRFLNPVWEVTNVFFVFFFVGIVGFFPLTAPYVGAAMLIPLSVSLFLLAVRGAFYAFYQYGADRAPWLARLYGIRRLVN